MKLNLNDVRLVYPAIFTAKAVATKATQKKADDDESNPLRFSACGLMTPNHSSLIDINNALSVVANAKWGVKGPATLALLRKTLKICLHEGDEKPDYEGFPGNWFISASNKVRPRIVDRNNAPLEEADGRPYAGCYVNMIVDIWAQDNSYGKRINATLMGVQFLRDGDALGVRNVASVDDFKDLTAGANAEDFADLTVGANVEDFA